MEFKKANYSKKRLSYIAKFMIIYLVPLNNSIDLSFKKRQERWLQLMLNFSITNHEKSKAKIEISWYIFFSVKNVYFIWHREKIPTCTSLAAARRWACTGFTTMGIRLLSPAALVSGG